ncbi:hypothetical protein Tco_1247695 [Tanacetum coccineum]
MPSVKVSADLLPEMVTSKNLTTIVNKTSTDMTEIVDLVSQLVSILNASTTPLSAVAEGEKCKTEVVPKVEEPAPKRLKVVIDIPKSMPLNFMRPTTFNNMPFDQFSTQLFRSGQSEYTTTPPINRIDKGKSIATPVDACSLKAIMPLMEQGGSTSDLSILKKFRTVNDLPLNLEEVKLLIEKKKRLAYSRASNEKSKKALKRMNPT